MLLQAIVVFFLSLLIVLFLIPIVVKIATIKRLYDEPNETRKLHSRRIPNLGGIGIYAGILLTITLLIKPSLMPHLNYLIAGSFILVIVGIKDDIIGISPTKKLYLQVGAAFIMAYCANIRITSFYGIVGVYELSFPVSIILTTFINVFIYNAINLIDGVDGLAGGLGLISSFTFAWFFYRLGSMGACYVALTLAGSLTGFLYFNVYCYRLKVFMGDSGSLLTGFLLSVLAVLFVEQNKVTVLNPVPVFNAAAALAFSILIIPLFDTTRVFLFRIINGKSPFTADNNHVHHRLLFLGKTHLECTTILLFTNYMFILASYVFQSVGNNVLIVFLLLVAIAANGILWVLTKRKIASNEIEKGQVVPFKVIKTEPVKKVLKPLAHSEM